VLQGWEGEVLHLSPQVDLLQQRASLVIFHRPRNRAASTPRNVAEQQLYKTIYHKVSREPPPQSDGGGVGFNVYIYIYIYRCAGAERLYYIYFPITHRGKPCLRAWIPVDMN